MITLSFLRIGKTFVKSGNQVKSAVSINNNVIEPRVIFSPKKKKNDYLPAIRKVFPGFSQ